MEEYYVSFEQAVKLKEAGFDLKCRKYYSAGVKRPILFPNSKNWNKENINGVTRFSAPQLHQVQTWIFRKTGYYISPYLSTRGWWGFSIYSMFKNLRSRADNYRSYEEALSAGITEALSLIDYFQKIAIRRTAKE